MKLYIVMLKDDPIAAFPARKQATEYAETHYGSKQDGICVSGIEIRAFTDNCPSPENEAIWENVNEGGTLQERTI